MTFLEILLVIVVIVILVALFLPAWTLPHGRDLPKMKVKIEMADLANAIEFYEAKYGCLPLENLQTNKDITTGIQAADFDGFQKVPGTGLVESNADLIVVLMNLNAGANTDFKLNPKRILFLNAKMTGDMNSSGVGIDYQYRDPWGNPYIISLDANQDGFVRDALYSSPGLFPSNFPTSLTYSNGLYMRAGKVMIWSRGPDGKANFAVPANRGVNKDNVVSWE